MKFTTLIALCIIFFIGITGCQKDPELNKIPVAEAGDARTIQLPKDTIILRGSGADLDGTVNGYLWSKISGPNTPVIHNNGSPVAYIEGMIPGTYVYQFMVIDNMGATGIDSVKITMLAAPVVTLSLQPAQNPNEMYIVGNNTTDQGSSQIEELGVFTWTNTVEYSMRTAMKFDLSTIPANATIISAKLSLYSHPNPLNGNHTTPNFGSNNAMLIQRITTPWVASSVLWPTQPSSTTSQQVAVPSTTLATMDLVDINVKDLVSSMLGNNNYGFLLKLQVEAVYNSRLFCSSRYPVATKRPKLEVVYQSN